MLLILTEIMLEQNNENKIRVWIHYRKLTTENSCIRQPAEPGRRKISVYMQIVHKK